MLQTMLEASSTAVPLSLKTDTQYSEVMDVSGLSEVRGERRRVSDMALDCIFFIWDGALFHERVCIVHINNSTSVTCITCIV